MRAKRAIALALGVAALVRFWAIDFCLPSPLCRPDEEAVAAVALRFFARHPNPGFFDWPPLFMYAVALGAAARFNVGRLTGGIRSEYRFLQTISADPSPLFLIARVLSALAGVASVLVVHRIAMRLFDRTTAIAAAWFLALAFLHARDSHFGVTDVTAILFVLLALLFVCRYADGSAMRDLLAAAAFTALAAATKYNGAMVGLAALWMIASESSRSPQQRIMRLAVFAAAASAGFLLLAPFSVIEFDAFTQSLRNVAAHLATGHGAEVGRGWSVHLTSSLRYGVGLPMLALGIAGLLLFVWRRPRHGVALLIFPLATYLAIGNGLTVFARYALPIVPFLCLGAAYAVTQLAAALSQRIAKPAWQPAFSLALSIIVLAPSAISTLQFDRLLAVDDSRIVAARWIEARYPGGATFAEADRRFDRLQFQTAGFRSVGAAENPDLIVVSDSPLHPDDAQPVLTQELLARYAVAFETGAVLRPGAVYDWQDEFLLPLSGFHVVERPGPHLTVLTRR